MAEIEELSGQCISSLLKCTDNVLKYLDGNNQEENLNSIQSLISEYCLLDYQKNICETAMANAVVGLDITNIDTLDVKFATNLKENVSKLPNISEHNIMKDFKSRVKQNAIRQKGLNDSDIITTQSSSQLIDPITKKTIVDPVKNKTCGHIYEFSAIKEIMKINNKTRCPVVGCGNRNVIKTSDLLHDKDLKLKISQNRRLDETVSNLDETL